MFRCECGSIQAVAVDCYSCGRGHDAAVEIQEQRPRNIATGGKGLKK